MDFGSVSTYLIRYQKDTRNFGEVVVSECHVILGPVNLIGCPVKCVGTANLVMKLSVTQ